MFTKAFLADLAERALSTAAQAFLAAYVVMDLRLAALTAAGAGGLSVVKAVAAGAWHRSEDQPSASLLPASVAPVAPPPAEPPPPKRKRRRKKPLNVSE